MITSSINSTIGRSSSYSSIRLFRWALTCLALACGLLAPVLQAANITRTYSFVATNFYSGPETRVIGSFTVTFDPAVEVTNQTAGITVNTLSIPYTGAMMFDYYPTIDRLYFGANSYAGSIAHQTNDFSLTITSATSTSPNYQYFAYARSGVDSIHTAGELSPSDIFSGGWVNGGDFSIGAAGATDDTNNWPSGESPWQAADGDANTKFLLFKGSNAGLVITPPTAAIYNRLSLTTANDASERDPASYKIYGSTSVLPTSGNIPISGLTLIQEGELALTDARKSGPAIVQFNNTTAYAGYLVVFPATKGNASLTQIAEVKLSQGMTVPHQVPVGKARGGHLSGNTFTLGTVGTSNPGNNWPSGQSPANVLDGDDKNNFLLFRNDGMGVIVAPEAGSTIINSLSFWTASDAPERDPLTYKVYGSSATAASYSGTHGVGSSPWTLIQDSTPVSLPAARNSGPTTVNFTNTTAYTSYLVVFPSVRSTSGNNITQIAEIAFANVPPANASPTFSDYAFSTPKNTPATVAVAKILARAADSDGGTLALTGVSATSAQGGSVSLSSGNVTYTPANNYSGLDTFSVTISDGQGGSVIGTITVDVTDGSGVGKNQAKITVLPGGNVALLFQGIPGQEYVIERSTDLIIWTPATSVTAAADGTIPYTDTNPPPGGSAFYRTAIPQN